MEEECRESHSDPIKDREKLATGERSSKEEEGNANDGEDGEEEDSNLATDGEGESGCRVKSVTVQCSKLLFVTS